MRRCKEDRWDFSEEDSNVFPMYVHQGGTLYGFCPAKATWDNESTELYKTLIVSRECGIMLTKGGLLEQPAWFIDVLSWFTTRYDHEKFASRARMILGDGKDTAKGQNKNGSKHRRTKHKN